MIDKEEEEEDLDIRILRYLSEDGRRTKSFLAEKLNKSPNTIKAHVETLETEKTIKDALLSYEFTDLSNSQSRRGK